MKIRKWSLTPYLLFLLYYKFFDCLSSLFSLRYSLIVFIVDALNMLWWFSNDHVFIFHFLCRRNPQFSQWSCFAFSGRRHGATRQTRKDGGGGGGREGKENQQKPMEVHMSFYLFVCLLGSSHVTVWILLILVLRWFRVSDYNYFLEHFKAPILQCSMLRWLPETLILTVCRISWRRIIIYCRLFIKLCELPSRNDSLLTKSDYKCTFSCTLLFT